MQTTPPARSRVRALLPALLTAATPLGAQAVAGGENATAAAQSILASAGVVAGVDRVVEGGLAQTATGEAMSSASYRLESGVVWTSGPLGSDAPLVVGVRPGVGSKDGGEPVTVVGMNLDPLGAADVAFAGELGSSATVTGSNTISVTTPAGVDLYGNPLAEVPVAVSHALGGHEAADAYAFLPAISVHGDVQVGRGFELSLATEPGALYWVAYGRSMPGSAVTIAPFDGALAVLFHLVVFDGGVSPTGWKKLPLAVPDEPSLAGAPIDLQLLSITDLNTPAGAFSNSITITPRP